MNLDPLIRIPRPPTRDPQRTTMLLGSILLSLLLSSEAAQATDGIEPLGVSAKAQGRGGADVAIGDTALSQIDNPATLSLQRHPAFDLSGELLMCRMHWTSPAGESNSQGFHPLANLGVAMPVGDKFAWGVALQSKAGMGSNYEMRHLMIPFMKRDVGCDLKNASLSLNAAYRLTDRLSLGVGGRFEIVTTKFNAVTGPVAMEFGRGYACGGGFNLGLHYQATDTLALGLSYRSPTWFGDLSGGDLTFSPLGLFPIHVGPVSMDDWSMAQKINAGVAWDATPWMKLIGETRWVNMANSSFNASTVRLNGPVSMPFPFPLGYEDQWVFIAGTEFKLSRYWRLDLGYNYATNPIPREHFFPLCPAIMQHHVTLGLRYETDKWWVGGGYIYGFSASHAGNGRTRIPLGVDYAFSDVDQRQQSIFFGFGFHW